MAEREGLTLDHFIIMEEIDLPDEIRVRFIFFRSLTTSISKMLSEQMQRKCKKLAKNQLKEGIKGLAIKDLFKSSVSLPKPLNLKNANILIVRNVKLDKPLLLVNTEHLEELWRE